MGWFLIRDELDDQGPQKELVLYIEDPFVTNNRG